MFDILFCIRDDHDLRFVLLAAAICLLSTVTAVLMIRQSRSASARARLGWTLTGGFATGFGIWATHFVAMLGYDPGIIVGYEVARTAGSLLVVLATTIAALLIATRGQGLSALIVASVLAGSGFAAMHYVGMAALEMPALFRWNTGYLALSIVLAIVPLYPAFALALRRDSLASGLSAALIMTGAIVGLHFSGMTAINLIPSRIEDVRALLSPTTMSVLIAVASACLLTLCLAGIVIARRTRAAIRASEMQFSALIKGISDCAIYMLDAEGRVANWNAGAQKLKGYSPQEIVGQSLSLVLSARGMRRRRARRGAGYRARDGQVFRRRLAAAQGRHAVLGACHHRTLLRRPGQGDRLCQDHARHVAAERGSGPDCRGAAPSRRGARSHAPGAVPVRFPGPAGAGQSPLFRHVGPGRGRLSAGQRGTGRAAQRAGGADRAGRRRGAA